MAPPSSDVDWRPNCAASAATLVSLQTTRPAPPTSARAPCGGWNPARSSPACPWSARCYWPTAPTRTCQIQLIPGILQTEAYARAIITADHDDKPTAEIDRMVRFRMARRSILERPEPSALRIVLDEAALHRVVGGPEVMRGQLDYLLTIADHPAACLRILPFDAGAHPAMGTPFTILAFDQDPAVVYLENFVSAVYPERPDQLTRFTLAFSHLCDTALTPTQSAEAIRDRMRAMAAIGEESAR